MTPFERGKGSYYDGINPYHRDTSEYDQWQAGWVEARRQDTLTPQPTPPIGNLSHPPTIRYRLNTKYTTAGVCTTDLTVEVTGEGVTLEDYMALQKAAQAQVDDTYPPPALKVKE